MHSRGVNRMKRRRRLLFKGLALLILVTGLMLLSQRERWHYDFYHKWKSPDGQYIVNAYRRNLGFLELVLNPNDGAPWLVELVDAKSGELFLESTVVGLLDPFSIRWDHESCQYARRYPPWKLPRRIIDIGYRYKYQVPPEQSSSTKRPACLRDLDLATLDLASRVNSTKADQPRRFCGLELDDPPKGSGFDPGFGWLRTPGKHAIRRFHRNLNPYRDELAGIAFDNRNEALVVVFRASSKALVDPQIRERLKLHTNGLRFRLRERCFTEAQSDCAHKVIARQGLWLSPGTKYLATPEKTMGSVRVEILNDEASAKALKALLGPLVEVQVVEKIGWGQPRAGWAKKLSRHLESGK